MLRGQNRNNMQGNLMANKKSVFFAAISLLLTFMPISYAQSKSSDFNGDGFVSMPDFFLFRDAFDSRSGDSRFDAKFDLDSSGHVNFDDFFVFADEFGKDYSQTACPGDFDDDGKIDYSDFFIFADKFGRKAGEAGWDPRFNLNDQGNSRDVIDFDDFFVFSDIFGGKCS